MPFLAFDMEIAQPVRDGADLLANRPGIACAGFMREGDARPTVLFDPSDAAQWFDPATHAMTRAGAMQVFDTLAAAAGKGDTIVTWNGAGFDFRLLADETGRHADCAQLARKSVDMMFQVLCDRGHPLALDTALKGMEIGPKVHSVTSTDGRTLEIDGAAAPRLWQQGEYRAVMEYCGGDVAGTLALAVECQRRQRLCWISQRGRPSQMPLPAGWLSVDECLGLPRPDTSWMTAPIRREDVLQWMTNAGSATGG
jgi:hypothetical protein